MTFQEDYRSVEHHIRGGGSMLRIIPVTCPRCGKTVYNCVMHSTIERDLMVQAVKEHSLKCHPEENVAIRTYSKSKR